MRKIRVHQKVRRLVKRERVPQRALCFLGPSKFIPLYKQHRIRRALVAKVNAYVYEAIRKHTPGPKVIVEPKGSTELDLSQGYSWTVTIKTNLPIGTQGLDI